MKTLPTATTTTLCLLAMLSATTTTQAVQYRINPLGTAGGYNSGSVTGLNNAGVTVGASGNRFDNLSRGYYTPAGGSPADIPFLPGNFYNWAVAINDNNQVAVENRVTVDTGHSVSVYNTNTNTHTVVGNGRAYDINNAGTVLGQDSGSYVLMSASGVTPLTAINALSRKNATRINNNGAIIGHGDDPAGGPTDEAFIYDNGTLTFLDTLPGAGRSFANDINDSKQVVGHAEDFITGRFGSLDRISRAFLWDSGVMQELNPLATHDSAAAFGINNIGQAVGTSSRKSSGLNTAVIYANGTTTALEDLIVNDTGWTLYSALDINDNGDIVGNGFFDGVEQGYILTAVPVPGAVWLFGSGLLALLLKRRVT